jgi:ketosteroid isomerase-like protein
MKTMIRVSLLAITAFVLAACQPAANTNTTSNTNANTAPKAAAPTADSLMALDTKAWDAYKNKDGAFFSSFLDDKYVSFNNGKREGKAENVKGISEHKCDFKSHTLSDPKITMAGADAAVLTYKATIDATCVDDKGKSEKIPPTLTVASVYVRSGDTWKAAYHNEVALMEPPKPADGANSNKPAANKESAGAEKKEVPPPPPPKEEKKPASNSANAGANTASSNSNANATSGSDALTDAIMAVEKKGWESWMKQDAKALEETTSKDVAFVDAGGKATFGQAEVIKGWTNGECKVSSVNVSDGKASMINADVAILTYKGTAVGTCGDMKLEPLWGTTVAIKEGNSWKAVYIFETPMMEKK